MIIINMALPSSCKECSFCREDDGACIAAAFNKNDPHERFVTNEIYYSGIKPEWCPIIGNIELCHNIHAVRFNKKQNFLNKEGEK